VIWVRAGIAFSSASEKLPGLSTRPETVRRQSAKPVAAWRSQSSVSGLLEPLTRNLAEMSPGRNSRASRSSPISEWLR
jgi:hypothetical protein